MGHKTDDMGHNEGKPGQTGAGHSLARAHAPSGHVPCVPRDTLGRDNGTPEVVGQDKASTPFRTSSHPTAKVDSRFAGWIAGASQAQADRFAADMLNPEQRELFRLCGERILANHAAGRKVTPEALADGKRWAAFPPLAGPMSAGVPDKELPAPLRGGNLEVF